MVMRAGEELRNPDQYFEADDLSGEQARGERSHDTREDGCGGEEEADGSGIGPEHLRGWNPLGDPRQQAWHVVNVADAEGDRRRPYRRSKRDSRRKTEELAGEKDAKRTAPAATSENSSKKLPVGSKLRRSSRTLGTHTRVKTA